MVSNSANDDKKLLPIEGDDYPVSLIRHITSCGHGNFTEHLARELLASYSLNLQEKYRVVQTELCEFQAIELSKVFAEERTKFVELYIEHPRDILKLLAKNFYISITLARLLGMQITKNQETAFCKRIALRAKKRGVETHLDRLRDNDWTEYHDTFRWLWRHAITNGPTISNHPAWSDIPAVPDVI